MPQLRFAVLATASASVVALACWPIAASAAGLTAVFEGGALPNWSIASNWSTGAVPDADDDLVFVPVAESSKNDLGPLTPVRTSITFQGDGLAATGGDSLLLDGAEVSAKTVSFMQMDVHVTNGGSLTVDPGVSFSVNGTLTIDDDALEVTTGVGSEVELDAVEGPGELHLIGPGLLSLESATGPFSGPLTAENGIIEVRGDASGLNVVLDHSGSGPRPAFGSSSSTITQIGDITLDGAVLSPGRIGPGFVSFIPAKIEGAGDLFATDSTYLVHVYGVDRDWVHVDGQASLGGMMLDVRTYTGPGAVLAPVGTSFDIIEADLGVVGAFTAPDGHTLVDDEIVTWQGQRYQMIYGDTYVALTYLGPVPAALADTGAELLVPFAVGFGAVAVGGLIVLARRRSGFATR